MRKVTNQLLSGLLLSSGLVAGIAVAEPVEFKVLSDWGSGYNAQLKLTNETDKPMTDWRVSFDFDGDVKNLYSGRLVSGKDGHFVLEGSSWNKTIKPGKSVILGWNGSKGGVSRKLNNVDFAGTDITVPTGPYFIGYDLQADWGMGYVASIRVSNNGEEDMNGWALSFDYPYPITHIYNGKIVSHEGDRYTIEGVDEGADLHAQEASVFVIRGNVGGLTEQPSNISFNY
jgi:hypothetical protein